MSDDRAEQLRRSWTANAEAWTRAVRDGAIESRRAATDQAVVDAVLSLAPGRVLDVGCGEGWLARTLADRGVQVLGVDASAPLVAAAGSHAGALFRVCSYAELAAAPHLLGESFDAIVCNFALLEEDLSPLLLAFRQILTDEGTLLIQTVHPWAARGEGPYRDGWRTESFAGFGGAFPEPMPWYYRTLESWTELLRSTGYQIRSLREPRHPERGDPLSLLVAATPERRTRNG